MPTRDALVGLLFSMHRGLISTAPWFAFGLLGPWVMARRRELRALWLTLTLSTVYLFLAVASSSVWFGGWAFGPRLLIPACPCWRSRPAMRSIASRARWPLQVLARASVVVAVVYQQLVHVTFAELPPETLYPLRESVAPLLSVGVVAPNVACKLMPLGPKDLIPLALSLGLLLLLAICRAPAAGGSGRCTRSAASVSRAPCCGATGASSR